MHHMFPNTAVISKPNKKHSKRGSSKKRKNSLYRVLRRCRCTCALPLTGFVWGSAEACILRAGGGKHFITEIRRLSEPCDSQCRTCLPFTHRCRLSQREGRGGGFRGPPSLLLRLMKFEARPASRHIFEADAAVRIVGMGELSSN